MSNELLQIPLGGMQQYEKPDTTESILRLAIQSGAGIDTIERLVALKREERDYQSRVDFDIALNDCQKQIGRIAPNQKRNDTGSMWSDYAQLDRTIRPIYTAAGFSVTYCQVTPITPGKVAVRGRLSRAGVSRDDYYSEITPSTTGPKGGVMATATDADAIAASRAKRYVLLDIFNIAVGIDKEEKAGIPEVGMDDKTFANWRDRIEGAASGKELTQVFIDALKAASEAGDKGAARTFEKVKNETWTKNGGFK